jgi:SAM-dependent methyltransferase
MSGHAPDRPGGPAHDAGTWDARYTQAAQDSGTVWSLTPNATVHSLLADAEPGTAVDLGAGEGRNAIWLAGRGWNVTAVDFSEAGQATGRTRADSVGLAPRRPGWRRRDHLVTAGPHRPRLAGLPASARPRSPGAPRHRWLPAEGSSPVQNRQRGLTT